MTFSYRTYRQNAGGRLATTVVILLSVVFNNQFYVMGDGYDQQLLQQLDNNQLQPDQMSYNPSLQQQPQTLPTMNNNRPLQQPEQQQPQQQYQPQQQQPQTLPNMTNNIPLQQPQQQMLVGTNMSPTNNPSSQQLPNSSLLSGNQQPLTNAIPQFSANQQQPNRNNNKPLSTVDSQQEQLLSNLIPQFNPNQQPLSMMPSQQQPLRSDFTTGIQQRPQQQQTGQPQQQFYAQLPPGSVDLVSASSNNNDIGLGDQQSLIQFQQQQSQRLQNAITDLPTTFTGNPQQPLSNFKQQVLSSNPQQQLPNSSQQFLSSNQQQLPSRNDQWSLSNMANKQQPNGNIKLQLPPINGQQQQQYLPLTDFTSETQQWPQQQLQTEFIDNSPKLASGIGDKQNVMEQQPMLQKFQNQFDQGNRQPQYSQQQQFLPPRVSNLNGIHRFSQMGGTDQPQNAFADGQLQSGSLNGGNGKTGNSGLMDMIQQPMNMLKQPMEMLQQPMEMLQQPMEMLQQPMDMLQQGGEQITKIPFDIGQSMGNVFFDGARSLLDMKNNAMNALLKPLSLLPQISNSFTQMEKSKLDKLANMYTPSRHSTLNSQPSTYSDMDNRYSQSGSSGQLANPSKLKYPQQNMGQQPNGAQYIPQQISPNDQYYPQKINQPSYLQQDNKSSTQPQYRNPINPPQPIRPYSYYN